MNYTTYYTRGQKVFLINTTPGRDETLFEAFSATIVSCDNQTFELRPRYTLHQAEDKVIKPGMQYKVTAESYGSGVQFNATISEVNGNGFSLKPTGPIEMYQRSQVPRMDLVLRFRTFTRSAPFAVYRNEWLRFQQGLTAATTERLELASSQINLGVGGLRYLVGRSDTQTDLAMLFIELNQGQPPICAVAEQLWRRSLPNDDNIAIGRRFVLISKADQKRLETYILQQHKKTGKKTKTDRHNWELLDRMFHQH